MTVTSADVAIRLRAENKKFKAENARLREALEKIANNGVNPRGEWTGFDHVKIAKAALSAKETEPPRCKHDIHGNDCFECFPTLTHNDSEVEK